MVTATQINQVTDPKLLCFTILYVLDTGPEVPEGAHWGDAIADGPEDDQWLTSPWLHRVLLWLLWNNPYYQANRHRICGTDAEHLALAVEDLGSQLSISQNVNETDMAYGKRLLCAQLLAES